MDIRKFAALVAATALMAVPAFAQPSSDTGSTSSDQSNTGGATNGQSGSYGSDQNMDQNQAGGQADQSGAMATPSASMGGTYSTDQSAAHPSKMIDASSLSKSDIKQIQKSLNSQGFDAGPVDGVWGSKVTSALQSFQQAQGLNASGQLDRETLSALNVSVGEQGRMPAAKHEKGKKKKGAKKGGATPSAESTPSSGMSSSGAGGGAASE